MIRAQPTQRFLKSCACPKEPSISSTGVTVVLYFYKASRADYAQHLSGNNQSPERNVHVLLEGLSFAKP